jgi:hypothetical protein
LFVMYFSFKEKDSIKFFNINGKFFSFSKVWTRAVGVTVW